MFSVHNPLKQGDALSPLLFHFALEYAIRKVEGNTGDCDWMGHVSFWSVMMLMTLIYWG
jgi:hypothetical protein